MSLKFNAAVLRETGRETPYILSKPLQIEEVELETPHEKEVLVKIQAASLCRSDLSVISGVRAWPMPIIPGHEASGVVEEIGSGVTRVKPGDRVVLVFQPQCGSCPACIGGDAHLCGPGLLANREGGLLEGGTRLTANETPVYHHMGLSAFAEYAVVSETSVVPMPDDIPFDVGALFGCGVMCGAGTVLNTAGIKAGDSVAIVGAGGVGSSAILGAELAGAREIFVLDKDPKKLSFASQLGATQVINNDDDKAFEKVVELSKGGVDYAFETAGTLGAFESAYHSTRRGGTVVALGLVDPQTTFSLDIAALVTGAKAVKGSYIGSCNPMIHIPQYMELYRKGRFPVDKLISHHLPLEDINIALDRMNKGDALRQIIDFQ